MRSREMMAKRQGELLDVLLDASPTPPGFVDKDLQFAGRSLREKHARVAAKHAQHTHREAPKKRSGIRARVGALVDRLKPT